MIKLFDRSYKINCRDLIMITFSLILIHNLSFAMGSTKESEKNIFIYSGRELSIFFNEIGCQDFWTTSGIMISRNSDGTELRFSNKTKKKVIVAKCDGSIKELESPGFPTWLNDEYEAIAWHDQNKGMVFYKNGFTQKISGAFGPDSGPDASGTYFIKYPMPSSNIPLSEACGTQIFNIENPELPLAELSVCGIRKIFFKKNQVFLFGNDYTKHENINIDRSIAAHILQKQNDKLTEVNQTTINPPRVSATPFYVEDLSPWDDNVLLIDIHDLPTRSVWYMFDLNTHEIKKIGKVPYSGGWGFFLQCDIIEKVIKKVKSDKDGGKK